MKPPRPPPSPSPAPPSPHLCEPAVHTLIVNEGPVEPPPASLKHSLEGTKLNAARDETGPSDPLHGHEHGQHGGHLRRGKSALLIQKLLKPLLEHFFFFIFFFSHFPRPLLTAAGGTLRDATRRGTRQDEAKRQNGTKLE